MTTTQTSPGRVQASGLGVAYAMTGVALGAIFVSWFLGALFTPDMVTGSYHEHIPISAYTGWIFDLIAISMLVSAAMRGVRARVTEPAPWMALGLGVSAIWLAVTAVSIWGPVSVTGTDPTQVPVMSWLAAIAGVIVTAILCNFVKVAAFEPAESARASGTVSMASTESAADDPTVRLRRLAQLRDSGAITDDEFQNKKNDLLSRI